MHPEIITSPTAFLEAMLGDVPHRDELRAYEAWWETEGRATSDAIDRAGTPPLRLFDRLGRRVDEVLYVPAYRALLRRGYRAGAVWRAFGGSLVPAYLIGYLTSFYDVGVFCPHTVSLATAVALHKYGTDELKTSFLEPLLRRDDAVWQGATWMTEAAGGSDLGAAVLTEAMPDGDRWRLRGEKYFASNAGAEVAVVAARPRGAPAGVRGLALFVVPRQRRDGGLNYVVRRLKDKCGTRLVPTGEVELHDSEAYLLGAPEQGVYLILEVLNVSRVANSVGSVALAQRAIAEAYRFGTERVAFGKPVLDHPLLRAQFEQQLRRLQDAFALAWEALRALDAVWQETPPYSDAYHRFRLLAHLAKYWTAEVAVRTAVWSMIAHGGAGVVADYPVERLLREAMILPIWEGTPQRQMLDGLEVMQRREAHHLLFQHLAADADPQALEALRARTEAHLALDPVTREGQAEELFADLASFTAASVRRRLPGARALDASRSAR
jgi:alkylation response protein AidB-like acyl-CoA dehydrogenase